MGRCRRQFNSEFPYHVGGRCINRDWFRLPMESVWQIFEDYLYLSHLRDGLQVHAFVLMTNHFHLIASTPQSDLGKCMQYFLTNVSREITRMSGRINQTFGGPYHPSSIVSPNYYLHAYKYVYRNPVEAGLSERVEDYPFSTIAGLLGKRRMAVPMLEDSTLVTNFEGTLEWLNEGYRVGHREQVRKALRKPEFELSLERGSRRRSELVAQPS